jgi:hypothetical protein
MVAVMSVDKLKAALAYAQKGLSVIPVKVDKKPLIKWEEFQQRRATAEEIQQWFSKWPDANIAIVTGKISAMDAIDCDSLEGEDRLIEVLGDDIRTWNPPQAKSPKGKHQYVESTGESNKTGFLPEVDYRGEGGYIIAPPSVNADGKPYFWLPGRSILEIPPARAPLSLYSILINAFSLSRGVEGDATQTRQNATKRDNWFKQGYRDESLFHIANHLVKGGMPEEEIQDFLRLIARQLCDPPFPEKEIQFKIQSALHRSEKQEINLTQELREFITRHAGDINATTCDKFLENATKRDKHTIRRILLRFEKEGLLERTGRHAGEYRIVQRDFEEVDLSTVGDMNPIDVRLPLDIHEHCELMPKDLVVFAGTTNSGKTAIMLDVVRLNMHKHKCFYFSTELGRYAAKKRIAKHKECKEWNFRFIDDFPNFIDVIRPDDLNFIDYVEVTDGEFYKIPSILAGIQKKLKKGLAFVALQKNPGLSHAVGGYQTKSKPALFCNLEEEYPGAKLTMEKVKNWTGRNPNGMSHKFHIIDGMNIMPQGTWIPRAR